MRADEWAVVRLTVKGTQATLAEVARIQKPTGMVAADGALLVTSETGVFVRVDSTTGAITPVAGKQDDRAIVDGDNATARFTAPRSPVAGNAETYLVIDGPTVRSVNIKTGVTVTRVGDARRHGVKVGALPAGLNQPRALGVTPSRRVLLVDAAENALLAIDGLAGRSK